MNNSQDSLRDCPICHSLRWIVDLETNVAVPCECQKKLRLNNKLKFANIPETFKENRLSDFNIGCYKDKATIGIAIKTIKYWLDNLEDMKADGIGLYFYSSTKGSGKTKIATSIANELLHEHDMQVKFATSLDIISEIKSTWQNDNKEFRSEYRLIDYLTSTEVLVIDDFGTEHHKDWLDDKFYQIINTRYVNKLITIFTSNCSLDNLDYDERILNRIKERVYQIPFPEESVRDLIVEKRLTDLMKG